MKISLIILFILSLKATADLPQMSDETRWLGYFVGWEERNFDYGYGADGEAIMHYVNKKEVSSHTNVDVRFNVQEKIKGKWVTRKILEDGLQTTDVASKNPRKPVTHTITVTGDTKVEIMQTLSGKRIIVKPKILEKKTENEIRFTMTFRLPDFFRHMKEETDKEIKKLMRSDYISMKRANDGKKVKFKLYEKDIDLADAKMIPEGATEFEFSTKKIGGKSISLEQGDDEVGIFEVEQRELFYKGPRVTWIPDQAKLGEKDAYVSFAIE